MALLIRGAVLLVVGVLLWAMWRSVQPKRVFVIRLVCGEPQLASGTVTKAFLEQIRDVAAEYDVRQGAVAGLSHGAKIRLRFSSHFPDSSRQRLRNWWSVSGWTVGRIADSCPPGGASRAEG